MAFVLVQHLDPHHKSMLVDLLGRHTEMKVIEAADGMRVAANRIFIIPPNATLTIDGRRSARVEARAAPRASPADRHLLCLAGRGSGRVCGLHRPIGYGERRHAGLEEGQGTRRTQPGPGRLRCDGDERDAAKRSGHGFGRSHHSRRRRCRRCSWIISSICTKSRSKGCRRQPPRYVCAPGSDLRLAARPAPAMTSASTSTTPCCGGFSAACRCCASTRAPPSSSGCARSHAQVDLLFREFLIGVTQFFRDPHAFDALQTTRHSEAAGAQGRR